MTAKHLVAVATALVASAAALVVPASSARAASPNGNATFDTIARCIAAQHHLLITFVLDESASLGDASERRAGTDPTGQRVDAAQVALDGFTNLSDSTNKVDVLLTGFSDDLHVYGGWQPLDAATRPRVRSELDAFRTRDRGIDTDFYNAVSGIQRELARKSATFGDRSPCELVLLFTDGRFDIDSTSAKPYDVNGRDPKARKAVLGMNALCAPNGPMQRLRDDGAQTITVALDDRSAPATSQPDRAFLERLASGDCSQAGAGYGASFDAANAAGLVEQFDAVATELRGASSSPCAGTPLLDIAPSIGGFHVFADTGERHADLIITPPRGPSVRVAPSRGSSPAVAGVALHTSASGGRFVVVDAQPARGVAANSPDWVGRWSLRLSTASAGSSCRVAAFAAWRASIRKTTLKRGSAATLVFDLVGPGNAAVPQQLSSRSDVSITATAAAPGSNAPAAPLTVTRVGNTFEARYTVPEGLAAQTVEVTSTAHVRLGGVDVRSTPTVVQLAVSGEPGFPVLSQSVLRLSSVSGAGIARGSIHVAGADNADGRVCIDRTEYSTRPPVPVDRLTTARDTCVAVPRNANVTLPFAVRVGMRGEGRVRGVVYLRVTGPRGRAEMSAVPFTFSITRPVSAATRNGAFVVLLLFGLLAPLVLLWILGARAARFRHAPGLRVAQLRIRVFADGTMRRIGSDEAFPPLTFEDADFVDAGIEPGTTRAFRSHGLEFVARQSLNPFLPPYGCVRVPHRFVTASEGVLGGSGEVTTGRVPLVLAGTWIFVLDPAPAGDDSDLRAADGTVTAFIAAGAPFADQAPRMLASLRSFFADLAARVAASATTRERSSATLERVPR